MNVSAGTKQSKRTKEITVSRVYNATIEAAFDAWTNPASLAKWFGPTGFSAKILTHDLRVGGDWRFLMLGKNGTGFHHFGSFVEITPPNILKFTWASEEQVEGWRDEEGNPTLVTVKIEAHADGVQVTVTHRDLQSDEVRQSLMFGWCSGLGKLTELLEG